MKKTASLALLFLVACPGKPVDPLASDRARLLQFEQSPPQTGWPSQATVLLSQEMITAQLQQAVTNVLKKNSTGITLPAAFGVKLHVIPKLKIERMTLANSAVCDSCFEVTAELKGGVGVGLSRKSSLADLIGLGATTTGTLRAFVRTIEGGGRLVEASVVPDGNWSANVALDELPTSFNSGLSQMLQQELKEAVALGDLPTMELAELPADGPVQIRDLRVGVVEQNSQQSVAIEFAFQVLAAGELQSHPDPEGGLVAAIPAKTALGIARAAALRSEPVEGRVVEPFALKLDGDRFELSLRIWEIAAKPTSREFRVIGMITLNEQGDIEIVPEDTQEIGETAGDINPVALLTRIAILDILTKSLAAAIPGKHKRTVAGQEVEMQIHRVQAQDDLLLVYGSIQVAI